MAIIYALINPKTDHPYYVGKTEQRLSYRLRQHIRDGVHASTKLLRDAGIQPEILELDQAEWPHGYFLEAYWIYQLRAWGFNIENVRISKSSFDPHGDWLRKKGLSSNDYL